MSAKTYTKFRLLCGLLFLVGVVSATVAVSTNQQNTKRRHAKGFTLITRETVAINGADPAKMGYVITVRYRRSDGTWRQVRTYRDANGKVLNRDIGFGLPGSGVFHMDSRNRTLEFLSAMPAKEETSYVPIIDGHSDPNFVRDDTVQGYATYVLHFSDQDGGFTEIYYAPELDNLPIKRVAISPGGVDIMEAVSIVPGEPNDRAFVFPNGIVNFDHFKEKIRTMEESGNHEAAQALQQQLDEQLAKLNQ
jgi:hypothetical protein